MFPLKSFVLPLCVKKGLANNNAQTLAWRRATMTRLKAIWVGEAEISYVIPAQYGLIPIVGAARHNGAGDAIVIP